MVFAANRHRAIASYNNGASPQTLPGKTQRRPAQEFCQKFLGVFPRMARALGSNGNHRAHERPRCGMGMLEAYYEKRLMPRKAARAD